MKLMKYGIHGYKVYVYASGNKNKIHILLFFSIWKCTVIVKMGNCNLKYDPLVNRVYKEILFFKLVQNTCMKQH